MLGIALKNAKTGKVVYTPPQDYKTIVRLMQNLEKYINEEIVTHGIDPLIKMAIIHHQFESIHPFYDGNGRTRCIIIILYLVLNDLLDIPILYLSKYIIDSKDDYYKLLNTTRSGAEWEPWILYMLKGVEVTAQNTIIMIENIKSLMQQYKEDIGNNFSFYSQDLLNNLFMHSYTNIDFLAKDLNVSRLTATKYLEELVQASL